MGEILIRGRAESRLAPTEATITVTVRVLAASNQADAVDTAANRAARLDTAVNDVRETLVRQAVTTSLTTGPEYDHTAQGRRLIGYAAARTTALTCEPDGEGLTALLAEVASIPDLQVAGPVWSVAPDAQGYDQLRTAAAADARRKAEAYAAGLGVTVGRVAWIAEPGLRLAGGSGTAEVAPRQALRSATAPAGADHEPQPVTVVPEPVPVTVSVEVGFAIAE